MNVMGAIWIFGGTTEGRELAAICAKNHLPVIISVATEYGEQMLSEESCGTVLQGRMDREQMKAYIQTRQVELVIDATHPYAVEVTEHIKQACKETEVPCIRLLRTQNTIREDADHVIYLNSVSEAAAFLSETTGSIMLTTGSKSLSDFSRRIDARRLYPRVLPAKASLEACEEAGIPMENCIAMQGPFQSDLNAALLTQYKCNYLVTKESGTAGGFEEKLTACQKAGAIPVVIRRPAEQDGMDFDAVCGYLAEAYQISTKGTVPVIDIVGVGMGTEHTMTAEVRQTIHQAEVLIGGARMLEPWKGSGKLLFDCYQADQIRTLIDQHRGKRIAVLMSGDVGFYSGAKKLTDALTGYQLRLYPGISSVVYMAAKTGISWQDMVFCSVHGRSDHVPGKIRHNQKVFLLAGTGDDITGICKDLEPPEREAIEIYVGENLSYTNERIWHGSPDDCQKETFGGLCTALFINHKYRKPPVTFGIPDDDFIRGNVPMTKEEVRILSISKLKLTRDAIIYDIGAGTGSVSVEAANTAAEGMVYAIEKKEEAAKLIEQNAKKFGVPNIQVIRGSAPEAMKELPPPTHAFIGGSSGNLKEIISVLQEKSPHVRIVMNAISLETIAEITELAKTSEIELITVNIAKANPVGNYHLMMGQNPVLIGTMKGR